MRLEHDGARGGGDRAIRTQADLLALQILECLYLRSGVNIERTDQQLGDIVDPLFDVSRPACFLAELEGIEMGDGRIDALEIQGSLTFSLPAQGARATPLQHLLKRHKETPLNCISPQDMSPSICALLSSFNVFFQRQFVKGNIIPYMGNITPQRQYNTRRYLEI
jgi:hypothetical protein